MSDFTFTFNVDPFGPCKVTWARKIIKVEKLKCERLVTICLICPVDTDLCYRGIAIKNPVDEDNIEYGHEVAYTRAYESLAGHMIKE